MLTEFGKLLRIIRIYSGDSAKQMAEKLHISGSYLSAIEAGQRNIPLELERKIENVYDLSDIDRAKLRDAMISNATLLKVDMTELSHERQKLILALVNGEIGNDTVEKMCALAFEN